MPGSRIGVLGGTFDPIHLGHLAAAQDAAAALELARVLFVPNRIPPHKRGQNVAPAADRVAMVELCMDGNEEFELSRVEVERNGPSFTLDTMRVLRSRNPGAGLVFLTGSDSLAVLHTWHEPDQLVREFALAILSRRLDAPLDWPEIERRFPGLRGRTPIIDIPQLEISSEMLRQRVREGKPIRYYVPQAVEEYICMHELYLAGMEPEVR
ncbi:MAG: nicotinate-nucleotide adenylyltransferase [Chloroflexota bacterium]